MLFLGTSIIFTLLTFTIKELQCEHPTTSSFEKLVDSKLFLDKTMFLEHFLLAKQEQLAIIGPRHFGKSSMLDTLKHFLEIQVTGNGTKVDNSKSRRLFEKTNIFKKEVFFTKHFARYPVIYFNFSRVSYGNFDIFSKTFVRMINEEFTRHRYLLDSKALDADEQTIFKNFSRPPDPKEWYGVPNPWAYIRAGRDLAILLEKFFGRKPIALVANYDAFKTTIVGPNFVASNYHVDNMIEVLSLFIGALVTDNYIERSLFTGVTRFGAVFKPYATNLHIATIFDSDFSAFWGVSEAEILNLAEKAGHSDKVGVIKEWYSGYHILGSKEKIYSMSVIKFMETGRIGPYWGARLGLENMKKGFEYDCFGLYVDKALKNGSRVRFLTKLTSWNLLQLKEALMVNSVSPGQAQERADFFLQFLTENGYFSIAKVEEVTKKSFVGEIVVPNREIREDMESLVYNKKFLQDKNEALSRPKTTVNPLVTVTPSPS